MTGNHHPRRRSNAELDALIDGQGDGTPLAGLVNELRDLGMTSSTVPNESLTEFVSAPHRAPVDGTPQTLRRKPMITSLVATLGTTAGKVLVGSVAAAAVVTGAIAADVSNPSEPIEVAAVQTSSSSSTSTTVPTSTSIATSTTTDGSASSVTTATTTPDRSTSTETTTTTTVVGAAGDQPPQLVPVLDAGSMTFAVTNGAMVVVGIDPAAGWIFIDESRADEIDISFRSGDDRVDLDIEFEDGEVRIRIRDRRTDTETESGAAPDSYGDDGDDDDSDHDDDDDSDHDDDDSDDDDSDDDDSDDDDELDDDDDDDELERDGGSGSGGGRDY